MLPELPREWREVNLFDFILKHVLKGAICSFFHDGVWNDHMMQDFIDFDEDFLLVACEAPTFMARRAYQARHRMLGMSSLMSKCVRIDDFDRCS